MTERVTSEEVMRKLFGLESALMKKTPIDTHPFLSLAVAFGTGFLLSQMSSRQKENAEAPLSPFIEKLIALVASIAFEKIAEELQ